MCKQSELAFKNYGLISTSFSTDSVKYYSITCFRVKRSMNISDKKNWLGIFSDEKINTIFS